MPDLYIPKKIKIGFQSRQDTFTGKLAFITYEDSKGVLRQQSAWNGWRDHKIEVVEFENNAQSGFIFNKGVQRHGYWGSGRSVIRVYDSRDFEFEISVDNLIGILMHSDISKRDIVESCVFAWANKSLVLLPVNSEEYQKSLEFTQKQHENVSAKDLVEGYTYNLKKSKDILVYMGYHDWWDFSSGYSNNTKHIKKGKKHVFFNTQNKQYKPINVETLSTVNHEEIIADYPNLVDNFFKTYHSQPVTDITINFDEDGYMYYRREGNNLIGVVFSFGYTYKGFEMYNYQMKQNTSISFEGSRTKSDILELNEKWEKFAKVTEPDLDYTQSYYYNKEKEQKLRNLIRKFLNEQGFGTLDMHLKNGHKFGYQIR